MHITGVYIIINDMLTSPDCFPLLIKQQNMDITCQYSLREEGNAASSSKSLISQRFAVCTDQRARTSLHI